MLYVAGKVLKKRETEDQKGLEIWLALFHLS